MARARGRITALDASATGAIQASVPWSDCSGERRLVHALLRWLIHTGRIGSKTVVALEVPWRGRRIDLALATDVGRVSTFEFKGHASRRVFEQAIYNSHAAHRSYVVVGSQPSLGSLDLARDAGVGVIAVNGSVQMLVAPAPHEIDVLSADRLAASIRERAMRSCLIP